MGEVWSKQVEIHAKMADDVEVRMESALNSLLNVMEKSGNLWNVSSTGKTYLVR